MSGFDPLASAPLGDPSAAPATLAVGPSPLLSLTVGALYSYQPTATGGTGPYTWSASGLPPGVTIDGASGLVSGYPTAVGAYLANIRATDSLGVVGDVTPQPQFAVSVLTLPPPLITNAPPGPYNYRLRSKVAFGGALPVRLSWIGVETLYRADAQTRVSWIGLEALYRADAQTRVSWIGVEVLRSVADRLDDGFVYLIAG